MREAGNYYTLEAMSEVIFGIDDVNKPSVFGSNFIDAKHVVQFTMPMGTTYIDQYRYAGNLLSFANNYQLIAPEQAGDLHKMLAEPKPHTLRQR